ncbi:MAG TPA: cyanophycin synthetase, partial [Planctomycetota bacterium]|nr:cyanophycin synthetase [Planctomycetota bacterium]
PGRGERLTVGGVPVVLDGAHVPSSVAALLDDLAAAPGLRGPPVAVLGLGRDKDAEGILKVLGGRADRILCTSAGTGLSLPSGELAAKAGGLGRVENHPDPRVAVVRALDLAEGGWVLVTGSLHLVGAVRPLLRAQALDPRC